MVDSGGVGGGLMELSWFFLSEVLLESLWMLRLSLSLSLSL